LAVDVRSLIGDWKPSRRDVEWLRALVDSLKVGGVWIAPKGGVAFEKVGEKHIRLMGVASEDVRGTVILIEKTKLVGEKAGIRVDTDKSADFILLLFHDLRVHRR